MSSENIPPVKKLKQATLNFFKSTTPPEALIGSKTKKRKNPSPVSSASPNKTAKLSKALVTVSEPPNSPSKQIKGRKSSFDQTINDHEVSSSSEADSGSNKASSGKCCLMERFICKLPKESNQEISSTNDVLYENILPKDKNEEAECGGKNEEAECHKENEEVDCIILNIDPSKDEMEVYETSPEKTDIALPEKAGVQKISVVTNLEEAGEPIKDVNRMELKNTPTCEDSSSNEKSGKSEGRRKRKLEENLDSSVNEGSILSCSGSTLTPHKLEESQKENLNDSVNDCPFLPGTDMASTPHKDFEPSPQEDDTHSASTTPKTPASAKRGRKVDSAKKAEKEAQKLILKEQKELERSEKKRKLEEEKAEKERVKQEKKEAKEKERQELKEKLQKEKEEKDRLKEMERKKKEEERLLKEEEKKKIMESKLEEKKKKDDEKKKKEEEKRQKEEEKQKEEEEKKKKAEKAKHAFQSFFIKPKDSIAKSVQMPKPVQGKFVPFELKKDMHLAPATRRDALSEQTKLTVDQILENSQNSLPTYLEELRTGTMKPHKTGRLLRMNPKPSEDIEVVHDPEALKKVQHKVKLLQFHTDYRPPYYGTWRKTPKLSPKNPWKKDESLFDYEIDSDDEWEEEEPGESLSCSDGEDEKGDKAEEEENEDEEDGWMVPHGYLSEDEGCNEDDEITPEKLKLQQLAKAKAWEEEQKRKLQAAPVIAVGCFFEHSPSPLMTGDVRLLYEFRGVVISPTVPIPTGLFGSVEQDMDEPTTPDKVSTTPYQRGCLKKAVPDDAMPDLIRLVHGNTTGIKRLIRDFRVFWLKKETPDSLTQPAVQKDKLDESLQEKEEDISFLNDSVQENPEPESKQNEANTEKKKEEGHNCSISKRQLDIKINAIAVREKRPGFHKTCWYVHENILEEFGLAGLVCNSLVPPEPVVAAAAAEEQPVLSVKDQRSIMDFALSKEELAKMESLQPKIESVKKDSLQIKVGETAPQTKTLPKDQMSIMEFAQTKEELAKREANLPKSQLISQAAPKDAKKTGGQMSIMNFARIDRSKSEADKLESKPQSTPMEVDPDVIVIDSTSDVEMSTEPGSVKPSSSVTSSTETSLTKSNIALGQDSVPSSTNDHFSNQPETTKSNDSRETQECFVRLEKLPV